MRLKTKRKITAENKSKQRKHKMTLNQTTNARRCVTQCAASSDKQFLMRIILILSSNKQWYIQSRSSLEHHNPPPLEEEATLLLQKDLSDKDKQLINILCDANVPPLKISKIMNAIREDDKGTLIPKTIFNINEKCRQLIDLTNGILSTCTGAEKFLKLLELRVFFLYIILHFLLLYFLFLLMFFICRKDIDYFCVMHVTGNGLFLNPKAILFQIHAKNSSVLSS